MITATLSLPPKTTVRRKSFCRPESIRDRYGSSGEKELALRAESGEPPTKKRS